MRAVIIDAGNTRVAFAAWDVGDACPQREGASWSSPVPLRRLGTLPTPRGGNSEAGFIEDAGRLLEASPSAAVVLTSVVPRVAELLRGLVPGLRIVDHTSPLPFTHRLHEPAATGADRLCNVAAAVAAGLRDAYVVDAGTATTVDVLRDGVFLGGVIAPGMADALEHLGRSAARLHVVPFAAVPLRAGADTVSALAAGGFHAGVGGVEALIAGLAAAHGPGPVVVTGGLGAHLAGGNRLHDPDWTFRGAAVLAGLA